MIFFFCYLNYSVYFHTVSFRTFPSPARKTKRKASLNNRIVEESNEYFVYLKLIQFPDKIESFLCFRRNVVYVVAPANKATRTYFISHGNNLRGQSKTTSLWSNGRHLASGSEGPGFELCQVDVESY